MKRVRESTVTAAALHDEGLLVGQEAWSNGGTSERTWSNQKTKTASLVFRDRKGGETTGSTTIGWEFGKIERSARLTRLVNEVHRSKINEGNVREGKAA